MDYDSQLSIKRIQALTDATFAVAMTILILEIKIPIGLSNVELTRHLFNITLSEILIYFVGFITLGIFWIGTHFHHHIILKTDRISSWLNILFLMLICIIPFSIGFLKNYRHDKLSIIFYSVNLIIASAFNFLMLWYAWKKSYIKNHYTKAHFINAKHRILIPIYSYLAIILVSFFSTTIAIYFFLVPIILHILPEKGNKINN